MRREKDNAQTIVFDLEDKAGFPCKLVQSRKLDTFNVMVGDEFIGYVSRVGDTNTWVPFLLTQKHPIDLPHLDRNRNRVALKLALKHRQLVGR